MSMMGQRSSCRAIVLSLLTAAVGLSLIAADKPRPQGQAPNTGSAASMQFQTDAKVQRRLEEATGLIKSRDWPKAADALQGLLDDGADVLVPAAGHEARRCVSL